MRAYRALLALTILLHPLTALAHPLVDEGRRRFEMADFEGALQSLRDAEDAESLTLDELIELYELRAIVYHALGDESGRTDTLSVLAAIDQYHQFGPEAPPEIASYFEGLEVAPFAVDVEVDEREDAVVLTATVTGDQTFFVRNVIVRARVGGGEWLQSSDAPLRVETTSAERIEWVVELLGPGGAMLLARSSEGDYGGAESRDVVPQQIDTELATTAPDELGSDAPPAEAIVPATTEEEEPGTGGGRRRRVALWTGVGCGVGAAVLAAIIVPIVVVGQGDVTTILSRPHVEER